MLHEYVPIPTLAVSDLARAREYYEGVLGFAPGPAPPRDRLTRGGLSPGGLLIRAPSST